MEAKMNEAITAIELAEKEMKENNFGGALALALEAANLYPDLDGVAQLVEVLNILAAHDRKINGEVNWYAVLDADPSADEEKLKKHYRLLAFAFHPDNNKSTGADKAFEIVSEAWNLLSNKAERIKYDNKMLRALWNYVDRSPPMATGCNAKPLFTFSTATLVPPCPAEFNTFSTKCVYCMTQYIYQMLYCNKLVLCPECGEPFAATKLSSSSEEPYFPQPFYPQPPASGETHASASRSPRSEDIGYSVHRSKSPKNLSRFAIHNLMLKKGKTGIHKKLMNERKKVSASKITLIEDKDIEQLTASVNATVVGDTNVFAHSSNSQQKVAPMDLDSSAAEKTLIPTSDFHDFGKEVTQDSFDNSQQIVAASMDSDSSAAEKTLIPKSDSHDFGKEVTQDSSDNSQQKVGAPMDLDSSVSEKTLIPKSDFHDFGKEVTEDSFDKCQVWAVYDGEDPMPRSYAWIRNVISKTPFVIGVNWLEPMSMTAKDLSCYEFPIASGDFRLGEFEVCNSFNVFSHRVNWMKGPRGSIRIFPKKGEVWALYNNWSPDWNEKTSYEVIEKYEMVEVVDDFNTMEGGRVSPIHKVEGFKSVFQRHSDTGQIRSIPMEEIRRLSHRVPSHLLTGQEAANSPKDCWDVDLAAMPDDIVNNAMSL